MIDAPAALAAALRDRYLLERELGRGGMATVYLAQDVKHHRKVALKILRPELAAVIGAERFLTEIRTTANLQHPHILPLFDSGSVDSFLFYVMPYVEGESLRDRLKREKQLPIADAVRIATEVASALDYAHRHGVIHRDIKPENILLQDGSAVVADFGIALAVSTAGGTRMTETGMSLGTPHYMSPEQAMGEREITARSDVYALGAVLYEMLVGEPPFSGPTAQSIVAKVLTEEPRPLLPRRHTIPREVEAAVLTSLEKLPADRFAGGADFAAALTGGPVQKTGKHYGDIAARRTALPPRLAALIVALALVIAALSFLVGYRWHRLGGMPRLSFGRSSKITSDPGLEVQPAISPDGRTVAYAAGNSASMRIHARQVSGGREIRLTDDTTAMQTSPTWSSDGSRILFLSRGGVFSAPASGGPARQEVPAPPAGEITSAAWSPDGETIAYVKGDSLLLRDRSGSRRALAQIREVALCVWSPNGELIACAAGNAQYLKPGLTLGNLSPSRIVVTRVKDGAVLAASDSSSVNQSPIWSPDGRSLYFVSNRHGSNDVYAVPIARTGEAAAAPMRLTTGLGAQSISLSADGKRLAYAVYSARANVWSLPIPSHPPVTAAGATPVTRGNELTENFSVSRDGRWLYYDSDLSGNSDIYRVELPGGQPERLTTDPSDDFSPDPSPDGREVAFHSWRSGSRDIYVMPLDGGPLQRVTSSPRQEALAIWSPDGSALAHVDYASGGIWIVRRSANGAWGSPVQRTNGGYWPGWSPDGRQMAYTSAVTGGSLMVIPVDSGASRTLIDGSRAGALKVGQPRWSGDGRSIFFKTHDAAGNASFWSIPAEGGTPRLLVRFDDPDRPSYRPSWFLGGNRIYFTIEDRQSDVWVIEVATQ